MNNSITTAIGIIFLLLLLTGCMTTPERPEQLIQEDQYISLLVELQLVRTYEETGKLDSLSIDSLRNRIFQKYNVTPTAFSHSHNYYQQFPEQQRKRINNAIEELRMDRVADSSRTRRRAP